MLHFAGVEVPALVSQSSFAWLVSGALSMSTPREKSSPACGTSAAARCSVPERQVRASTTATIVTSGRSNFNSAKRRPGVVFMWRPPGGKWMHPHPYMNAPAGESLSCHQEAVDETCLQVQDQDPTEPARHPPP